MSLRIFVGWDKREAAAYQVCVRSLLRRASQPLEIAPVVEEHVRALGILTRPFERRRGGDLQSDPVRLWDVISDLPMSTEFSLARFAVPQLAKGGWALFCDCDFLFRADVAEVFDLADPRFAVMVTKHDHRPDIGRKMDGQTQRAYPRKNWSSFVLWNCAHPSRYRLEAALNTYKRDALHGFNWLDDELIGEIPLAWNWFAHHRPPFGLEPKAVHFTEGTPDMAGYEQGLYADEWRQALASIAGRVA